MVKGISILGSTGSIGRQTAAAASRLGIPVRALAARRDIDRLEEQCRALRPSMAAVTDEAAAGELAARRGLVIACGGGLPLREGAIAPLKASGRVVWLRRDPGKT